MKVSIITVTYNSADTIEQTVLSVLSQSYPDIEYIIVDGKSTDHTLQVIEKYRSRIANIVSERDNGLYDALNKGIGLASGDIVGILHSDDFYTGPDVIKNYVEVFRKSNCDAVYADLFYVSKEDPGKIARKWKSGPYRPGAFLWGWMPPHPTFFVKKDLYNRFGKFSLQFKTAADYELMLRFIHKHEIKICYLPEFTVKMRVGGKSNVSMQSRLNANQEDRMAWRLNNIKPYFFTLYLKPIRKIFQFFLR